MDIDHLYDQCANALSNQDWKTAVDTAAAMLEWCNSDTEYDRSQILQLRDYCNLVITMHGHKVPV